MTRSFFSSDTAVSESLGYILIFGVVMACIALLYLNGSAIINDAQESTSYQGMEQSFGVVNSDLSRSAYGESPVMTSRVNVNYGLLCLNPSDVTGSRMIIYDPVGHNPADPDFDTYGYDRPIGNITFESVKWGKSITIENGAILEMYGGSGQFGTVMTTEPRIFYSAKTKTLIVSVINLTMTDGSVMAIGNGVASLRSNYTSINIKNIGIASNKANISIRTRYTGAWKSFLEDDIPGIIKGVEIISFDTSHGEEWVNATIEFMNPDRELKKITVITYNINVKMS
jgi:hypothetical protein